MVLMDFFLPFISILVAEFGDKTQLAVVSMSSKYKNKMQIFFGVMFAFLIIDGLAIYFAKEITGFISIFWIKLISGILFLLFGFIGYLEQKKEEDEEEKISKNKNNLNNKSPFFSGFFIILFAEFGDKSQITAGIFAINYNPFLVFLGVLVALTILTILAIFLGSILLKKFDKNLIEHIANFTFILIGVFTLISIFF